MACESGSQTPWSDLPPSLSPLSPHLRTGGVVPLCSRRPKGLTAQAVRAPGSSEGLRRPHPAGRRGAQEAQRENKATCSVTLVQLRNRPVQSRQVTSFTRPQGAGLLPGSSRPKADTPQECLAHMELRVTFETAHRLWALALPPALLDRLSADLPRPRSDIERDLKQIRLQNIKEGEIPGQKYKAKRGVMFEINLDKYISDENILQEEEAVDVLNETLTFEDGMKFKEYTCTQEHEDSTDKVFKELCCPAAGMCL
ncbi:hypothetical protein MC885_001316 [Smutsia gigantea]|nr:hypothetical protein MC885_001316 [Smutsia gigantea]